MSELSRATDKELMEEFVRRIKASRGWDHYGMKIEIEDDWEYTDIVFSNTIGDTFGFMFEIGPHFKSEHGKLIRIWGNNMHMEWMKLW